MNINSAKAMMDAFYEAKRIRDMLPPLPEGITPSYIHVLDCIYDFSENGEQARISDAADYLGLPRPVITRTIRNMESDGLLKKIHDSDDHRVIHVVMTAKGEQIRQKYVDDYFGALAAKFSDISDEEVSSMIETIHKVGNDIRA